MPEKLTLGGVAESSFLVENLAFPIREIATLARMRDAIDHAAADRKAVAVVGPKGFGKTVALEHAIKEFRDQERLIEEHDAKHRRRRIIPVQSPRSARRIDILSAIWRAILGTDPQVRVRGRSKSVERILEELVEACLQANVVVLAFDEAESLHREGLLVIRDIISLAERMSDNRFNEDQDRYKPAGVGVVLVGTRDLRPRLETFEETGQRLVRIVEASGLDAAEAARTYQDFLPAFARRAEELGQEEWQTWIDQTVTKGRPVSIRRIENHVRNYVRRMVENDRSIEVVEDIPWNEQFFLFTLDELAGSANELT